jgi:O-antigen/teichoic acid export membrane protein
VAATRAKVQLNTAQYTAPVRRLGLTTLDHGISSATNFAATVIAARLLGPTGLGMVSVGLGIGFGLVGVVRAVVGESLLVFGKAGTQSELNGALTTALIVSIPVGLVCATAGLLLGGGLSTTLIVVAATLPALSVQDSGRYAYFATRRPIGAVACDAIWGVGQAAGLVLLILVRVKTPAIVLGTWSLGAWCGAFAAVVGLRARPSYEDARRWFARSRRLSAWSGAQIALSQGSIQLTTVLVGVIAGLHALGAIRAMTTLLGPLAILFLLIRVVTLSEARSGVRPRLVGQTTLISVVLATAYLLVCIAFRARITPLVFGQGFRGASSLMLPVAALGLMQALAVGTGVGFRAFGEGRAVFLTQVVATAIGAPAVIALAAAAGASGAVWGMALQAGLVAGVSLWLYAGLSRGHRGDQSRTSSEGREGPGHRRRARRTSMGSITSDGHDTGRQGKPPAPVLSRRFSGDATPPLGPESPS